MTGSLLFACYPAIAGWGSRLGWPAVIAIVLICCVGGLADNRMIHWALLLLVIAAIPLLFARFSKSAWDTAIGELSYPVYLLHMLVIGVLATAFHVRHPAPAAIVTVILAIGMVRFVEAPVDRYRQWRHRMAAGAA